MQTSGVGDRALTVKNATDPEGRADSVLHLQRELEKADKTDNAVITDCRPAYITT